MTLVEDMTAWALGCGAEEAAQPGSGGGSHTRTVKPNSGSTAVSFSLIPILPNIQDIVIISQIRH